MQKSKRIYGFLATCVCLIHGCSGSTLLKDAEPDAANRPVNEDVKITSSIYWHLISVRDYHPSLEEATRLCIAESFHIDLPTEKVLSSREIKIPAKQTYYENQRVTRYREETKTGEVAYGIELEPITVQVPYEKIERLEKEVKAVCVGTEYILDTIQ